MRRSMLAAWVLITIAARSAPGDWKPPADNKFTEDQLKLYLDTANEMTDLDSKLVAAAAKAQSTEQRLNLSNQLNKANVDCLARHHISREQFDWLAKRVSTAWGVATYLDGTYAKIKADFVGAAQDNDAKLAEAQHRLAAYQAAQQAGTRVLSDDDRDVVVKSVKRLQQAALDEAKQHGDDADTDEIDAKEHDVSAQAADDRAANPPPDVSQDERADYINTKKSEAQVEREAAKDARGREADARKAQSAALELARTLGERADHPEIPVDDDQKTAAKTDNDAGIVQAQRDIDGCSQARTALTAALAEVEKSATETGKEAPPENLALIRKYSDQYKQVFERAYGGAATTMPSP
jgi:hypothetical protein